jgi:WD40 repeat protein
METIKGNPFKFLDSFTKEDKDIFFGREKEIEEIYSRVFQSNLLLVYGASGTGKTSLIQCGLANKFNDSDWLPVIIRRGSNILTSLRSQLEHLAITPLKENSSLKKSIQSLYLDHFKPIYLIFDQFEELFIFGTPEEIKNFVTEVSKIVKSDLQSKFIFVIRGEYLEHLTAFEDELPEFFNNRIRIEKMTRHNATEAISGPCRMAGIPVEEGFEQTFLETLSPDKSEVELTYLQVFLDKLYKKALQKNPGHPVFTNNLLQQIGKISDVLSDFLEEQIARIPDSETALAVLKSFVSMEGTKKQIDAEEIEKFVKTLGKDVSREQVELLVHQFVDLRILRDKDESGKYELRHDSLAIKIYEKITLVEKELIEVRALIESSHAIYLKRNLLINENDLAYIAPYERKLFLNEKLHEFLETSKSAASKTKRRRMIFLIVVAGFIFSALSGFTIWAMTERSNAMDLSREAERQTQLAEQEKNQALNSKDEAVKANKLAREEKEKAERNEKSAMTAKQQAELARQQAMSAMSVAEREKANAMQQSDYAKKEAKNAEEQKEIAKSEKQKAQDLEKNAHQNFLLSLAQSVALKSPMYKDNPQLQGLLALQAYNLNKQNAGNPEDPIIYDALRKATATFNHNSYTTANTENEIRAMIRENDFILSAMRPGLIDKRSLITFLPVKGQPTFSSYLSPVDELFFIPGGSQILSSHSNYSLLLWDLNAKGPGPLTYQELSGHKNLIRSIGFSPDGTLFASGGKDSLVLVWKLEKGKAVLEKRLQAGSAVKTVLFADSGKVYILLEDGTIRVWKLSSGTSIPYVFKASAKPTCMAYNKINNVFILGLANGNLWMGDGEGNNHSETKSHTARVDLITFDPEYKLMATSGSDRVVKIFETSRPDENPKEINDLTAKARCFLLTSEHKLVISCSDRKSYLFDAYSKDLSEKVSDLLKRNFSKQEWKLFFKDLPYSKTRKDLPE